MSGGNGGTDNGCNQNDPDLFFSSCDDLNTQIWSEAVKIASAGTNGYYNWAVDLVTCSRKTITGSSFRYYTNGGKSPRWFNMKFVDQKSGFKNKVLQPVYPP